jgi:hypothetical protein
MDLNTYGSTMICTENYGSRPFEGRLPYILHKIYEKFTKFLSFPSEYTLKRANGLSNKILREIF